MLVAPPGQGTRPTSDRLRETLFNVLGSRVQHCRFADLFAGSGAVGIEVLSRGARHALLVERAAPAVAVMRKNLLSLDLTAQATVVSLPVARALAEAQRRGDSFDIVFLDPPYEAAEAYRDTLLWLGGNGAAVLASQALVVAEHAKRLPLAAGYARLQRTRVLEQGDAALSFFALEA